MKRYILYSFSALFFVALISFNVMRVQDQEILIGKGPAHPNFNVTIGNDENRNGALYVNNDANPYYGGENFAIHAFQKAIAGQNVAVRAEVSTNSVNFSQTFGVLASSGNANSGYNFGVCALLHSSNHGAAICGTDNNYVPYVYGSRYAGYFLGSVFMSERVGIGMAYPNYSLDVWGDIGINGSLVLSSDARQKTNIKDMTSSLELIEKLRPVSYNFKPYDYEEYHEMLKKSPPDSSVVINNDEDLRNHFRLNKQRDVNRKHIGFIAQELREIFPELVYEDKKGNLSVDYISLIPVLVSVTHELNQKIQIQDKIIQTLSSRLDALENNTTGNMQGNGANNMSFSIFPNPASGGGFVTVDYTLFIDASTSVELFNTFGQRVKLISPLQNQKAGTYNIQTSIAGLTVGAYVVKVTAGNQVDSKQLIIN